MKCFVFVVESSHSSTRISPVQPKSAVEKRDVMCVVSLLSCSRRNLHSVCIACWYFNIALFITAWLLFAGILVRASAKHFGERCRVRQGRQEGIRMAAPIDTVMMKYRRQGPDEREDQGGWPRVPSISTHRVLLPQASVMWCGGARYCWHSQLESCTGSASPSGCTKGRTTFHPSFFFSVSVCYSCTFMLFSFLFLFTFVSSVCILTVVCCLLLSFFYISLFLLHILNLFHCLVLVQQYFGCRVHPWINTFWWSQQISFNALYQRMEQSQLSKLWLFLSKTRWWKMPNVRVALTAHLDHSSLSFNLLQFNFSVLHSAFLFLCVFTTVFLSRYSFSTASVFTALEGTFGANGVDRPNMVEGKRIPNHTGDRSTLVSHP